MENRTTKPIKNIILNFLEDTLYVVVFLSLLYGTLLVFTNFFGINVVTK